MQITFKTLFTWVHHIPIRVGLKHTVRVGATKCLDTLTRRVTHGIYAGALTQVAIGLFTSEVPDPRKCDLANLLIMLISSC